MPTSEEELKAIQEELKWISLKNNSEKRILRDGMGIFSYLVPAGCIVTAGILGCGIYQMMKRDSKKQQLFMRYRVLAQGVTIMLASAGLYQYKLSR